MSLIKKNISFGLLNTDDAPHMLPDGSALNLRNFRYLNSTDGRTGYLENIHANRLMQGQETIPDGSEAIATYEDPQNNFIIWFSHKKGSRGFDRINYYDLRDNRYWLVAKSAVYADDGEIKGGFGFETGVNYQLEMVGGLLVWVSKLNEPMKLHVGAAISASNPSVIKDEIPRYEGWEYDWTAADNSVDNLKIICKPPGFPPIVTKVNVPDRVSNNIQCESYQFAFMYTYETWESSVLSPFSNSTHLNAKWGISYNAISVVMQPAEYPLPQALKHVKLYVKVASTGKVFLIKKWDRVEYSEVSTLKYVFYGDLYGEMLDNVTANEPFHSVPLRTGTVEFAKGRLMLADNVEGYSTPSRTSLTLSSVITATPTAPANAKRVIQKVYYRGTWKKSSSIFGMGRPRYYYSGLYVKLEVNEAFGGAKAGYYFINGTEVRRYRDFSGEPPLFYEPAPTSVTLANLTYKGRDIEEIKEATRDVTLATVYGQDIIADHSLLISIVGLPDSEVTQPPIQGFLHYSDYAAGIVFYDKFLRKCGVVTSEKAKASLPMRDFSVTTAITALKWELPNDTTVNSEIPEWAYYYAPVLRKNSRASWFLSGYASDIRYAGVR